MEKVTEIAEAESKVLADTRQFLKDIRGLAADVDSLSDGIQRLRRIRGALYENLNQIQHEHLVLQGLRWLRGHGYDSDDLVWYWNPRQTGDSTEPDLLAKQNSQVVVCAEATTSETPVGLIDSRMRDTLAKLDRLHGDKFYFVRSDAMAQRARTKVSRNSWTITIVQVN